MKRMRRYRNRRFSTAADVSLTPLIDTALTLLIIFMITTPMLKDAIKVDLPKSASKESGDQQQQLVVSIDKAGEIFFNNQPITLKDLSQTVKEHLAHSSGAVKQSVWLRVQGDTTTFSKFTEVYDEIKFIPGIENVMIATQKAAANRA
jgi:biopolymer transport protein TolR